MKKHWYDYLWILSLTYLILGFFNILFAWLGLICFFVPLIISLTKGTKGYCNRYCGRGQLFSLLGGPVRTFPEKRYSKVDEEQMVPIWISGILLRNVLFDALEYIFGILRSARPQANSHFALDFQSALAVGLSWNALSCRRCPICLWLL